MILRLSMLVKKADSRVRAIRTVGLRPTPRQGAVPPAPPVNSRKKRHGRSRRLRLLAGLGGAQGPCLKIGDIIDAAPPRLVREWGGPCVDGVDDCWKEFSSLFVLKPPSSRARSRVEITGVFGVASAEPRASLRRYSLCVSSNLSEVPGLHWPAIRSGARDALLFQASALQSRDFSLFSGTLPRCPVRSMSIWYIGLLICALRMTTTIILYICTIYRRERKHGC